MNASEAKTFDRRSERHETLLAMLAQQNGCSCEPYRDWFTYDRWQAQGLQVQKGEKGTCLQVFAKKEEKDPKTGKVKRSSRPWRSFVFCRCQVKERGS